MRFAAAMLAMLIAAAACTAQNHSPRKGVLAVLEPKMKVALREADGAFIIHYVPGLEVNSHQVVEVGEDYVVIEDVARVVQTRIPIYAVKAVTITRIEAEGARKPAP